MQEAGMSTGRFGPYGGQFVPETLMAAVTALEEGRNAVCPTPEFRDELAFYLKEYAGRETPLTFCRNVSDDMGCNVYGKIFCTAGRTNSTTPSDRAFSHAIWARNG
jgi:tryptophan synthase beta subunit